MITVTLIPHQEIKEGDLVVLDREHGWIRLALPEDPRPWFVVPKGSRMTSDGYLEMPTFVA